MSSLPVVFAFCAFIGAAHAIGSLQSVGVKGVLMCDNKPASDVKLKLYDVDIGPIDDLLDEMKSRADGSFELKGHATEITAIDPKLNIYHDCNDEFVPCQRRISISIPDSYISTGPTPRRIYDAGTIQLSGKWAGEKRDCFNRA